MKQFDKKMEDAKRAMAVLEMESRIDSYQKYREIRLQFYKIEQLVPPTTEDVEVAKFLFRILIGRRMDKGENAACTDAVDQAFFMEYGSQMDASFYNRRKPR